MQVPAYCPALLGIQAFEYRGVFVAVKKTIAMPSMPIFAPIMSDIEDDDPVGDGMTDTIEGDGVVFMLFIDMSIAEIFSVNGPFSIQGRPDFV